MLEFKNVSVRLSPERLSPAFSLAMDGGEVACLSGGAGTGKSLVLMAILGLVPLASGYITIDGELVTPGSSAYFRRLIAYVPQRMPSVRMKVGQLFGELIGLSVHAGDDLDLLALRKRWSALGLPADLDERWTTDVDGPLLRTAMLASVPLLHKPIVLVDDPAPQVVAHGALQELAASGVEVLFATRQDGLPCHKIVKL